MANSVAYGFIGLEHLFATRATQAGIPRIYQAVQESTAEYTRQMMGIMESLTETTEMGKEQIELAGDGTLQPLDEWGDPMPVKASGSYDVAYPIQGGGTAWATNRVTQALLTVDEANRLTWDAMRRDADWVVRHFLAAILSNTTWTFQDKVGPNGTKGLGAIVIQPLANGDAVTYTKRGGGVATDDHYLAQLATIDDANNPFPIIREELMEHPSNMGPTVVYIASNLRADVEALATFIEVTDPNVRYGMDTDLVQNVPSPGPGDEVLGYIKGEQLWIVEWRNLPNNYMIAHSRGGGPVTKMREYPAPELKGFFMEEPLTMQNLKKVQMIRYAGFGVSNRIGALVYQIGSASYTIPTGFETPLAV